MSTAIAGDAATSLRNTPGIPALAVTGVSHAYGARKALDDVNLTVPQSRFTALLGLNGAGKTTTLKAVSNLLHAERGEVTKGTISFAGERVDRLSPAALVRTGWPTSRSRRSTPPWRAPRSSGPRS